MKCKPIAIRVLLIALSLFLMLPLTLGCGKQEKDGKITVVCTVFPLYDWARQICQFTDVELILLTDNGTDLHSYQPPADDMIQIATCDLLLTVGGPSDAWVEEALRQHPSEDRQVCRMWDLEGITLRQISEESLLCQEEDCSDTDHAHDHGGNEIDEHLWLSLKNAMIGCDAIASRLCELDAPNSEIYQKNLEDYLVHIRALDQAYSEAATASENPAVLFADRFPFVYLMEDYGIRYGAAFRGCTTDADADFDTILRLSSRVDEWGLSYVLTTENPVSGLAEQIRANTKNKNQTILAMNSLQSVTDKQLDEGITYLETMKQNLETLRIVLTNQ